MSDLASGELRIDSNRIGSPAWTERQQRRLIDSVLRGWPIGPIYVLAGKSTTVVDGGQRLSTLVAFVQGHIPVDGLISPPDVVLRDVDQKSYSELPAGLRKAFDDYPVVIVELRGLKAADVRPMLFRLNDDDRLTPAQRRTIESGSLGEQVREIVNSAADRGLERARIGFSNIGLAYEDVVTRLMIATEARDIRAASDGLEARAKSGDPVADDVVGDVSAALRSLLALPAVDGAGVRFSKATLLSWLLLLVQGVSRFGPVAAHHAGYLLEWFEHRRRRVAAGLAAAEAAPLLGDYQQLPVDEILALFNDLAAVDAMRSDVIAQRDVVLWLFLVGAGGIPSARLEPGPEVEHLRTTLVGNAPVRGSIELAADQPTWGRWA